MPADRFIAIVLAATLAAGAPAMAQQTGAPATPPRPTAVPRPAVPSPAFPLPLDTAPTGRSPFGTPGDIPFGFPGDAPPGQTPPFGEAPAATSATPEKAKPPASDPIPLPGMLAPDGKPTPNMLAIRAQYDAGMQTVDSGVALLVPFVGRTVIGLKRLALGRIVADRAIADMQWHQVVGGLRDLAVADQRLQFIDGILDRWRMAAPTSPQEQAAMLAGVHRRSGDIGIIRRQIACGRYFADVTGRAIRSGAVGGINARIPPGC